MTTPQLHKQTPEGSRSPEEIAKRLAVKWFNIDGDKEMEAEIANIIRSERQALEAANGRYEHWFKEATKARGELEVARKEIETERTMHNAWRKRAEEAEAENLRFIEHNVGIIGEWGAMERALNE